MRNLSVNLASILELVICAEDYGFNKSMLLSGLAEIIGDITDSDIEEYANLFISPEYLAQGYTQEDADNVKSKLLDWKAQYFND